MKPVCLQAIGKKDILNSYLISQLKRKENQRELDFSPDILGKEYINNLIKKDFWSTQDTQLKENIFIFAIQNFDDDNIYNVLNLIDWNNPQDDLEKKLKNYTIKNHADKILFNNLKLISMWKYNVEDLYNMFQCIDDNSNWTFKRSCDTKFQHYLEEAITNSSKDMFLKVLDKAKEKSSAAYSMLTNPLAISNKMECGKGFLFEEFQIFKQDYFVQNPDKQFKKGSDGKNEEIPLIPYLYIYDFIDLTTIVKGINSIRKSFSKNFIPDDKILSFKDEMNNEFFPHLYYNLSNNKLNFLIDGLLHEDMPNINIIASFPYLIERYGEDTLKGLVLKNMDNLQYVNIVFLKELSSNYNEDINKKIKCYSCENENGIVINSFYESLFKDFSRIKPENALLISYLCSQKVGVKHSIDLKLYKWYSFLITYKTYEY